LVTPCRGIQERLARRATEPERTDTGAAARNGSRGRLGRAIEVGKTARRARVLRLLRELRVVGSGAPPTREGAQELRRAFEELGTTYVKLGQLLSSRPELLPDVYIEELSQLTDSAPPLPFSVIEPVIAQDVGLDVFTRLDPEPLASASIAQVHRALMRDGRDVVVKVRRPRIEEQVEVDLELLRSAANLAGFCLAAALGLYMIWKIVRTPGEL
jgi:predicted unusual protein kinase regulating ubiquinone biosynthesis (AarF/ABC1/UbiB family)